MTAEIITFPGSDGTKVLTAHDRLEALMAASMNEERAMLCGPGQPALRTLLEMNAALFKRIAE